MATAYRDVLVEAGRSQARTHEGGVAYALDDWKRLRRFLILGSDGGSFYVSPREFTTENSGVVTRCINADPHRAQAMILEVYTGNVAPKVEPQLVALALLAAHDDPAVRKLAYNAIPMLRIGTHLFTFIACVEAAKQGHVWSRGLRTAVGEWYRSRTPEQLAYQIAKYQQRGGWSHKDVLRLAHVMPRDKKQDAIFACVATGNVKTEDQFPLKPNVFKAMDWMRSHPRSGGEGSVEEVADMIRRYRMTREMVPTDWLTDPTVWEALLDDMPLTAMIRNLGTMSKVGLLTAGSDAARTVFERLVDGERLYAARVHPLAVLLALRTYQQGHGFRGSGTWNPVTRVVDALDHAFDASFGNVPTTDKRMLLALDVSSSMTSAFIANSPLSAREAAAAMALVTAAVEPNAEFVAYSHEMVPLTISPRQRLDDVVKAMAAIPFGGTYCALPVMWASRNKRDFDAIVSYTDSETMDARINEQVWSYHRGLSRGASASRPSQTPQKPMTDYLRDYREQRISDARSVVVGMASNGFTLADPSDSLSLDVVGFDASAPAAISAFLSGEVE